MILHRRFCFGLLLLLSGCLVMGCGGKKIPVQVTEPVDGIITMDGVPLAGASVTFIPQGTGGDAASGSTDSDGKFKIQTLRGAPGGGTTPGEYRVTISKIESVPTGRKTTNSDGETIEESTEKQITPPIYASRERTPIIVNITKGKNEVNIELDSSAK